MVNNNFPRAWQPPANITASADLAATSGKAPSNAPSPPHSKPTLTERCARITEAQTSTGIRQNCYQHLQISFFFDGTGNNLDADRATHEMSNVAKLFLAHQETYEAQGLYSFYIPGIGTYFKDIGDPGGTIQGLAFGGKGRDRIDWALRQFDRTIEAAEALAVNPNNKIAVIRVAVFGFSRGAALARAFARDFQARCRQIGAAWQLEIRKHPVKLYFLGLWDTVASVGMPMSANNTPKTQSIGLSSNISAMQDRSKTANSARVLAFGLPGADPAPGFSNGHSDWADSLEIPAMVEKCVHMVAAHEIRNSFPLDSCRRGTQYPDSVEEMVYPGSHSDVGGGYRPGEGGRSPKPGQMLSLLPLRVMHRIAWENGVPLYPLSQLPYDLVAKAFAEDESSQTELYRLSQLWESYMKKAGFGGQNIGTLINSHMRLYYGWRFYKIRQNQAARARNANAPDQAALGAHETQWEDERRKIQEEMAPLKKEADKAHAQLGRVQARLNAAEMSRIRYGTTVDPALEEEARQANIHADAASEKYLKVKARSDTLPSSDGSFARNSNAYDDQLMADAEAIRSTLLSAPTLPVRPHYRNLLDAYEAEFVQGKGLRDEKIIEFFDNYVHDSLAGFGQDATLPSDPRVIYIGGDVKSRHAQEKASEDKFRAA